MSADAQPSAADFRRRRLAALAVVALSAFGLVLLANAVFGGGEAERADSRSAAPAAAPIAAQTEPEAAQVPIGKEIGQKIMSRMDGTTPGSGMLRRVRAGRIGGVILFADNVRSLRQVRSAVQRLQRAAEAGGNPPLLVAVDQEGGIVKRFATLPPRTSPRTMAARRTARREGARTGAALRDVGVNLDLAPVADVPQVRGSFLGSRAFGRSTAGVARSACAFAEGLRDGGVLPTLKHFPGLGAAGANTDFADVTITASAASIRAAYEPYRRCAGRGLVMIANARYPKLTGSEPAVLARSTYTRELERVGFKGVTISDDLQADGIDPIPELAVKSSAAGLDIALYAKTELAAARAFTQIERAVKSGRLDEAQIRRSAARIRALKQRIANRPAAAVSGATAPTSVAGEGAE